jgi:hypothetical protein
VKFAVKLAVKLALNPRTGFKCSNRPKRPFLHRAQLLAHLQNAVFPIALRVEPRKRGGKRGVVPASREPRLIVDQAQRAQRLDQIELARLEFAEVLVSREQIGKRSRSLGALAG